MPQTEPPVRGATGPEFGAELLQDRPEQMPLLVVLLVGTGLVTTFRLGWIQVRYFRHGLRVIRGEYDDPEHEGDLSHFQALSTALSATVGLGNIGGVALAIAFESDTVRSARIFLSGAAPVPWRAKGAEAVIIGTKLDDDTIAEAAAATIAGAEPLERNGYKLPLFEGLMREQLEAIRG